MAAHLHDVVGLGVRNVLSGWAVRSAVELAISVTRRSSQTTCCDPCRCLAARDRRTWIFVHMRAQKYGGRDRPVDRRRHSRRAGGSGAKTKLPDGMAVVVWRACSTRGGSTWGFLFAHGCKNGCSGALASGPSSADFLADAQGALSFGGARWAARSAQAFFGPRRVAYPSRLY